MKVEIIFILVFLQFRVCKEIQQTMENKKTSKTHKESKLSNHLQVDTMSGEKKDNIEKKLSKPEKSINALDYEDLSKFSTNKSVEANSTEIATRKK